MADRGWVATPRRYHDASVLVAPSLLSSVPAGSLLEEGVPFPLAPSRHALLEIMICHCKTIPNEMKTFNVNSIVKRWIGDVRL